MDKLIKHMWNEGTIIFETDISSLSIKLLVLAYLAFRQSPEVLEQITKFILVHIFKILKLQVGIKMQYVKNNGTIK